MHISNCPLKQVKIQTGDGCSNPKVPIFKIKIPHKLKFFTFSINRLIEFCDRFYKSIRYSKVRCFVTEIDSCIKKNTKITLAHSHILKMDLKSFNG